MSEQKPNRYELPLTSMVGAMIVVLACVLAYVGFRALNRDNEPTPVVTVDYSGFVKAGRADGKLAVLVPSMPSGWRATSATYDTGVEPHWHLGVLTSGKQYVGLEESLLSVDAAVQQYVDADARPGATVTIDGVSWRSWTDTGGDYALTSTRKAPQGDQPESVVVVGSASPKQVREFAASLGD